MSVSAYLENSNILCTITNVYCDIHNSDISIATLDLLISITWFLGHWIKNMGCWRIWHSNFSCVTHQVKKSKQFTQKFSLLHYDTPFVFRAYFSSHSMQNTLNSSRKHFANQSINQPGTLHVCVPRILNGLLDVFTCNFLFTPNRS